MSTAVRRFDDLDEGPISENLRRSSQVQSFKPQVHRSGRNWDLEDDPDESPIMARFHESKSQQQIQKLSLRQEKEFSPSPPRKSANSWVNAINKPRSSRNNSLQGIRDFDAENRSENETNQNQRSPGREGNMHGEKLTIKHAPTKVPEPMSESEFLREAKNDGTQQRNGTYREDGKQHEKPRRSGRYYESKEYEDKVEFDDVEELDLEETKATDSPAQYGIRSEGRGAMSISEKAILENAKIPFILVAHNNWIGFKHVRCFITRDRTSLSGKMYPTYELSLECNGQPLVFAKKMHMNATSNYHLFDMTRGTTGKELNKKSCNYIGKLRAQNSHRTRYTLVTNSVEREESAGICFERPTLFKHFKEGNQPRKLKVCLPPLDFNCMPIPKITKSGNSILDEFGVNNSGSNSGYRHFTSKEPVYENGNYRLNFGGRVTSASIKNFQLVEEDNIDEVICQFGKVGEDRFTLDYKSPLNAVQALSLALCQFNL